MKLTFSFKYCFSIAIAATFLHCQLCAEFYVTTKQKIMVRKLYIFLLMLL